MGPIFWYRPAKTWRTREGKEIPYDQLRDDHLLAILRMWVRRAALRVAADNVDILRQEWPEEAEDEEARLLARDWRSVPPSEQFKDLEGLARARGLDVASLEDYGRAIQENLEARAIAATRGTCRHCGRAGPAVGLASLLDETLAKEGPLEERDLRLVRLAIARMTP